MTLLTIGSKLPRTAEEEPGPETIPLSFTESQQFILSHCGGFARLPWFIFSLFHIL
jgi:hypothetical protein